MRPADLLDLGGIRRTPFVQQSEAAECGLACVAMVAGHHGLETDMAALRRRFGLSLKGATLKTLIRIAEQSGFNARPLRGEPEALGQLPLPSILHWDMQHFVVLTGVSRGLGGRRYRIHDPARGAATMSEAELSRHFTGVALELTPSERFQPKKEKSHAAGDQRRSVRVMSGASFRKPKRALRGAAISLALCGSAACAQPIGGQIRTNDPVPPDLVEHVLRGACGPLAVELSYRTTRTTGRIDFSDIRMNGRAVEGSSSALRAMLGSDYLQGLTLMSCLADGDSAPRPKFLMRLLRVAAPGGPQSYLIRTFEVVGERVVER